MDLVDISSIFLSSLSSPIFAADEEKLAETTTMAAASNSPSYLKTELPACCGTSLDIHENHTSLHRTLLLTSSSVDCLGISYPMSENAPGRAAALKAAPAFSEFANIVHGEKETHCPTNSHKIAQPNPNKRRKPLDSIENSNKCYLGIDTLFLFLDRAFQRQPKGRAKGVRHGGLIVLQRCC